MASRGGAAAAHPGVRLDRLSAALGQPCLLGNGGGDRNCGTGAAGGTVPDAIAGRRWGGGGGDVCALLRIARPAAATGHRLADRASRVPGAEARCRPCPGRRTASQETVLSGAGFEGHGGRLHRVCHSVHHGGGGTGAPGTTRRPHGHCLHPAARMVLSLLVPDIEAVHGSVGGGGEHGPAGVGGPGADSGSIYRPRPYGESDAAHLRIGFCGAGRSGVGRTDRGRRDHHAAGSAHDGGRLFGPHGLDRALARGNGRRGLLPPGELRQLPCHRRARLERRAGPHPDFDSQRRRVDDSAFQAALRHAAGHLHAPDSARRLAVELSGRVPAETQSE